MRPVSSTDEVSEDDAPALTIRAAAARLGVAVPTLRSWESRYGIGPQPRTPGAHRRYSPADMARLEYFCRLVGEGAATADAARVALAQAQSQSHSGPTAASEAEPDATNPADARSQPSPGRARGVARCAMRLDQARTLEILEETLERDGVIAAWSNTIEPALLAVGRKWTESQGRYVEVEHLLSWCITTALHRVRTPSPTRHAAPTARRVLLACSPNEWHSLPLEVLAAALRERGAAVSMLGAAVPAEALSEAVRRIDPACVVVWSQTQSTADLSALPPRGDRSHCSIRPAGPGWLAARPPLAAVLLSPADALEACLQATASSTS